MLSAKCGSLSSLGWLIRFVCVFMQFNMDRVNVEEFCEVYKGVIAEYNVSISERRALVLKAGCVFTSRASVKSSVVKTFLEVFRILPMIPSD